MKTFRDRYVLATGYPWAVGVKNYSDIRMVKNVNDVDSITMKWPEELWNENCPRYRLVLERVKR